MTEEYSARFLKIFSIDKIPLTGNCEDSGKRILWFQREIQNIFSLELASTALVALVISWEKMTPTSLLQILFQYLQLA